METWETLTMSRKEVPRAGLLQAALAGRISNVQGARAAAWPTTTPSASAPAGCNCPAAAPTQGGAWTCGSASPAGCSSSRTAPASPPSPRRRRSSSARAARPTAIARGAAAPPPPRCRVRPLRRPARPLGPPPPTGGGMRFLTPANAPSSALEDQGPVGSLRQVAAVGAIPPRCPATAGAGRTRRAPNGSGAT